MKVLIGIDDSKFSEDVFQAVVAQFQPENTEVLVFHVPTGATSTDSKDGQL